MDHGAAETEQKERISVRVMLMICFMQISACGKICPKVLAESRRYKEIDRRARNSPAEERARASGESGPQERQECMNSGSSVALVDDTS